MTPSTSSSTTTTTTTTTRLVWHRRDLRLHDNSLYANLETQSGSTTNNNNNNNNNNDTSTSTTRISCISLYVFNPNDYTARPSTCAPLDWDAVRVGPHAARNLLDALTDLRSNLQSIGGELMIRTGDPAIVIPEVARAMGATEVVWNEEPGTEEANVSRSVFEALCYMEGVTIKTYCGYPLYHPNDLPASNDVARWKALAHPKQKVSKKHKKNKTNTKAKNKKHEDCDTENNVWNDGYDNMQQRHSLVDVSPKRFAGMCLIMGDFRRAVRTHAKVRPLLDSPPRRIVLPSAVKDNMVTIGKIPTIEILYGPLLASLNGDDNAQPDRRRRPILGLPVEYIKSAISYAAASNSRTTNDSQLPQPQQQQFHHRHHSGGETAALKRLDYFLSSGSAAVADRSKADVTTNDDSSRLSMHFSIGSLSPRKVYHEAFSKSKDDGATNWMMSHLEMRDYFVYYALRTGAGLFRLKGAAPSQSFKKGKHPTVWNNPADTTTTTTTEHLDAWTRWATGRTGFPLVDAAMKELLQTGYCSNRVRQNAASFLTKDLLLDWRAGAELFQFLLDDFCVGANWGNWAYFSGVGTDPKQRHFRTISQALRYDPDGSYVQKWLYNDDDDNAVVLSNNNNNKEALFRPWDFLVDAAAVDDQQQRQPQQQQQKWPMPMVDPKTQLTWHDLDSFEKSGRLIISVPENQDTSGGDDHDHGDGKT